MNFRHACLLQKTTKHNLVGVVIFAPTSLSTQYIHETRSCIMKIRNQKIRLNIRGLRTLTSKAYVLLTLSLPHFESCMMSPNLHFRVCPFSSSMRVFYLSAIMPTLFCSNVLFHAVHIQRGLVNGVAEPNASPLQAGSLLFH